MPQRSLTALSAVALFFLLAISLLVWGEFGVVAVSVLRVWTGG